MKPWKEQGCTVCRNLWECGQQPPELEDSIGQHAKLHHCKICGAYWIQTERYAAQISEQEAREQFPTTFAKA